MATSHSNSNDNIAGGAVRAAHLLPILPIAGEVIPTMPVAVATWDEGYAPLDAILIWDGEQVAQAAMGAYTTMIEPLLASAAPRMYVVIAAHLAPLADGGSEIDHHARRLAWNALQSMLLSVQELGVAVTTCAPDALIPHIQMLLRRDRRPIIARRHVHPLSDRIAWLSAIAGIGIETARHVVEWCGGDLAAAWMALTDPAIPPPDGIAPGRWRVVQQQCRAWLGLVDGVRVVLDAIETSTGADHA